MKKKEVLKAIDKKNINSAKKSSNSKNNTKKKNTRKNNTKKNNIQKKINNIPITIEEKNKVVTEPIKEEKEELEEYVEVEVVERTFKEKMIRFGIRVGIILAVLLGLLLLFLSLTEYKPKNVEKLEVVGEGFKDLNANDTFTLMTWNIGYGALGDNADFFMDGGKMVQTANRDRINRNMKGVLNKIEEVKPNILFVQEVDTSSKRSAHVNELTNIGNHFNAYSYSFAKNLSAMYIPYPIHSTIGSVNSGIATFSKFKIDSSKRIALPSHSLWPKSTVNFKRCFLISYVPVKDTDKQLVLINVHYDAYISNKYKEEQTKKLNDLLKKETKKGNYVIVGGDFNQIFSSKDKKLYPQQKGTWTPGELDEKLIEGEWQFLMDEKVPTCRSLDKPYVDADKEKFQYYLIDGYIVSNNITVNSLATQDLGFVSSDHNPVVLNVTLK